MKTPPYRSVCVVTEDRWKHRDILDLRKAGWQSILASRTDAGNLLLHAERWMDEKPILGEEPAA